MALPGARPELHPVGNLRQGAECLGPDTGSLPGQLGAKPAALPLHSCPPALLQLAPGTLS